MSDPFFLTEFVSLDTHQLHQRGIMLHSNHNAFIHNGPYLAEVHFDWIEGRHIKCEQRGWLVNNIAQYGGNQLILEGDDLNFPNNLMQKIWEITESPMGTPFSDIKFGINKSLISFSENQLPFISWLNKNELN